MPPLELLPFFERNAGLLQHHREQTLPDISAVRIGDPPPKLVLNLMGPKRGIKQLPH